MSGLEVIAAVSAVVSAFHDGAELIAHIKKKRRRWSSKSQTQQDFEEKQLQDSLEAGETQVAQRFEDQLRELGDIVRVGDAIARDRLLHITFVIQAEIIKSLQLAVRYDNAMLNLGILHEASIVNRKDCLTTLDELKQRILITRPLQRTLVRADEASSDMRSSFESVQTFRTASLAPLPEDSLPPGVTFLAPGDAGGSKSGLAKYFSLKRNGSESSTSSQRRPVSTASNLTTSPALSHLLQGSDNPEAIMKDIDEIISSYQTWGIRDNADDWDALRHGGSKRDTLAILNAGDNCKRDTVDLNRDALLMLRNLPPTPEETTEIQQSTEYPAVHYNFDQRQQPMSEKPLPQIPASRLSTWSTSSSVYSDTLPPSLYSNDSISSYESSGSPEGSWRRPTASPYPPLSTTQQSRAHPPPLFTTSPRSQTASTVPFMLPAPQGPEIAPSAPFAAPVRPRTPLTEEDGILRAGRTRVHLVPDRNPFASSSSNGQPGPSIIPPAAAAPIRPIRQSSGSSLTHTHSNSTTLSHWRSNSTTLSHSRSNTVSDTSSPIIASPIHTSTIAGPAYSSNENVMSGRPCKDNNYWGFCKGSWTIREDVKKGLGLTTRPDGMYNTFQVWQCKSCNFEAPTYFAPHPTKRNKKETIMDPNIYTSAVGIKYRWLFLAKSHVKNRNHASAATRGPKPSKPVGVRPDDGDSDCNYGCVICSVEGNVTGIYGNAETLMNHIFMEHVRSMSEKTRLKSKCILGREAGKGEDWDLNIPVLDVL